MKLVSLGFEGRIFRNLGFKERVVRRFVRGYFRISLVRVGWSLGVKFSFE